MSIISCYDDIKADRSEHEALGPLLFTTYTLLHLLLRSSHERRRALPPCHDKSPIPERLIMSFSICISYSWLEWPLIYMLMPLNKGPLTASRNKYTLISNAGGT